MKKKFYLSFLFIFLVCGLSFGFNGFVFASSFSDMNKNLLNQLDQLTGESQSQEQVQNSQSKAQEKPEDKFLGTWYVEAFELDGSRVSILNPDEKSFLYIKANHTVTHYSPSEKYSTIKGELNGTWSFDANDPNIIKIDFGQNKSFDLIIFEPNIAFYSNNSGDIPYALVAVKIEEFEHNIPITYSDGIMMNETMFLNLQGYWQLKDTNRIYQFLYVDNTPMFIPRVWYSSPESEFYYEHLPKISQDSNKMLPYVSYIVSEEFLGDDSEQGYANWRINLIGTDGVKYSLDMRYNLQYHYLFINGEEYISVGSDTFYN